MFTYLTVTKGARLGEHFLLSGDRQNLIGRDVDCDVVLNDPLCSRVHAVIERRDGEWWLRDDHSRNGTFLDGEPILEAQLANGAAVRVGSAEFRFEQHVQRPTEASRGDVTETIVLDAEMGGAKIASIDTRDLLLLHQLSLQLLGSSGDPDSVVRQCLDQLLTRCEASVAGFLWLNDEGRLRPKLVLPEGRDEVALSQNLTELVCHKRRAVWIDSQQSDHGDAKSPLHFADAICVPLTHNDLVLGAVHLYLENGRFDQARFDVAIAAASMLVLALVGARRQASLQADVERLKSKSADFVDLIGESPPMLTLKKKIGRIARATGCVLIRGESGSGKELVARDVHRASPRSDRPMLSVNCAAIPRDLMESQLFGHKRGAFTGADSDHVGLFQQADSGTLLLDEVGEMTLEGQAKLLRILEGHPFLPVGATKEVSVDVRVIAATNRDLREFVRKGKFREDLFYRLSVFELHIAPLRQRGDDIHRLIDHFLQHFRRQHGRGELTLSQSARRQLAAYSWPGNVRQLRNIIDSAVVMCEGSLIQPEDLGLQEAFDTAHESLRIDFWERKLILEALRRTDNHVVDASKLLGIGRATLYRKIDEYGISR